MTIGELLKEFRIRNLKTQKEWTAGIVSPSYYSKVEKGIHRITAEDLLAILTANQIKLRIMRLVL
ncbi:helix-turn-helix domain-containing protein [Lactobacillus sp. M0396]|uniref:helix-turn-helix domain-containing protein n=1 Tax=Lactobacillus sp. M0396 TaxID=2751030 RepID=UPI0018DBC493|nr:helix-turn-helix transcriptional regulator [Lactobacillus sp. M0396]MBI0034003.1 helix-turn-helix transcriptional regulator [Lactobacillus sp. M0396]